MSSQPDARFLGNLPDIATQEFVERAKKADAEAVDRFLAAVGKSYIPPGLDKGALSAAIAKANYQRDHGSNLLYGSEALDRVKLLRRIGKTTEKLNSLLNKDPAVKAMIDERSLTITPPPMSPFQTVIPKPTDQLPQLLRGIASVQKIQQRIGDKWRTAHKHDKALKGRRVSEREYLAGVLLPLVYEWHFLTPAGRSRSKDGKPSGPMVCFIHATMQELELPYGKEAIVRAYSLRAPLRQEARKGSILPSISRQT
jgi:hypothetical protein